MSRAAELILPVDADRRDWAQIRRTGIGSSDVSALLGMSRWSCARDVWDEKTGRTPLSDDDEPSEAARWGTLLEPVVREEWSRRTGLRVTRAGTFRSLAHEFMLYNPDGLCADGGLIEIKTSSAWKRDEWDRDQIPDHAELQVQHGMAVMGLDHAWVIGLIGGQHLVWQHVARDDELIAMLVKAEGEFWHEHVLADVAPPWDGSQAAADALIERYPLAAPEKVVEVDPDIAARLRAAYAAAEANKRADAAAYTAAQNAFRELLGDAEALKCRGEVVATWTNNGSSFDEAGFRAAHPELAAQFTRTVEVIDRKALGDAHPDIYRSFRNRVLRIKS